MIKFSVASAGLRKIPSSIRIFLFSAASHHSVRSPSMPRKPSAAATSARKASKERTIWRWRAQCPGDALHLAATQQRVLHSCSPPGFFGHSDPFLAQMGPNRAIILGQRRPFWLSKLRGLATIDTPPEKVPLSALSPCHVLRVLRGEALIGPKRLALGKLGWRPPFAPILAPFRGKTG